MADYTGIRDECLEWPAGQLQTVTVPIELPVGRTLANWSSFVLTIREDPDWPRSGANLTVPLDPAIAGGIPIVSSTGSVAGTDSVVFTFNVPENPGFQRYALDVQGLGGVSGPTVFYEATWLTVVPSVH